MQSFINFNILNMTLVSQKDNIISSSQIIILTISFIFLAFIFGLLRKLFYYVFLKKRIYLFPRISTKGISNIAMVISISISCIIILIFLTGGAFGVLFRAYPGWRINIETMLIKTGGLLYGPIVGLFIGAMTDFLTIVITASSFHYGYFIVCILCGLISGLLNQLWRLSLKNKLAFCIASTVICALLCALFQVYVWQLPITIEIFEWITVDKSIIMWILLSLFFAVILLIWGAYLFDSANRIKRDYLLHKYNKKIKLPIHNHLLISTNRQSFSNWHFEFYSNNLVWITNLKQKLSVLEDTLKKPQKSSTFACFVSVLLMVVVVESIINVVIVPCFDAEFSVYPFQYWFILRILLLFILIPLNIFVIYSVFKIIISMTHFDTQDNNIFIKSKPITNKLWVKKH